MVWHDTFTFHHNNLCLTEKARRSVAAFLGYHQPGCTLSLSLSLLPRYRIPSSKTVQDSFTSCPLSAMEGQQALGATTATGTHIAKALPLFTRIRFWILVKLLKAILPIAFRFRKSPQEEKPTYTKTYPEALGEPCRVFIPASYKSGQSKLLPLFIDIHGGGESSSKTFRLKWLWLKDSQTHRLHNRKRSSGRSRQLHS